MGQMVRRNNETLDILRPSRDKPHYCPLQSLVCISWSQVFRVDPGLLCPAPQEGRAREAWLRAVCVLLALTNLAIFSRLLYDYWQYRTRGKLPTIIHFIPFL